MITNIPTLEELGVRLNGPIVEGPPDLIPGFMPRKGQLVIAGETNVGKTLVALEVISSLVTGAPLWGKLRPNSRAKKVLYVLGEHYPEVVQRLLIKTQLPISDEVYLLSPEQLVYDKWLVQRGQPNPIAVQKFQKWAQGCDLIVWDPLSAFCSGVDTENDNVQMRLVLDTMTYIAQSAGASCLVLAHQGKPMMDQMGKERHRSSYAIRGASGIEDAATNIFYMRHGEGAKGETSGTVFDMVLRKFKGEAPEEYRLLRDSETLTHTILGARPLSEAQRKEVETRVHALQAVFPDYTRRTCAKILATVYGKPESTMLRHLGIQS